MRNLLLVTACVFISGCVQQAQVKQQARPVEVVKSECYTVDLFTKVKVEKPAAGVPAENQQFLGEWGGGGWNDLWCHSLLVTKVYADGRVDLVDMHGPYEPWGQPATAFRRVGRIDDKGNLRFAHGTSRLSYRIENGKLLGTHNGLYGNLTVELTRRGEMPVPASNPVRLSQQASAAKPDG